MPKAVSHSEEQIYVVSAVCKPEAKIPFTGSVCVVVLKHICEN